MPCCGAISEINRIGAEELSLEWRIKKFLSLPGDRFDFCDSPRFKFCDARWRLRLYPYKTRDGQNPASVELLLIRLTKGPPKTFRISVGIKGSDGVEKRREAEKKFRNVEWYCEWEEFCWRSELGEHKARLMPGDILTVTCVIKMSGAARVSLPTRHGSVIRSLKSILAEGRRADFTLKSGGREWAVHRAILEGRSGHLETGAYPGGGIWGCIPPRNFCKNVKFLTSYSIPPSEPLPITPSPPENKFWLRHCLETLFRGEWAVRDEARFDDVAEDALGGVLHFIYAGEVGDVSIENVCEITITAHEFLLEDLESLCVEYMKGKMCPEIVCFALAIAKVYGEGDLKEIALECFFRESNRVVSTEAWKKLKENHPEIIGELFEEFIKRERKKRRKEQD